jgi:rod shape-determining protein MreD
MTRDGLLLLVGFLLIVVQGALGAVIDLGVLMPNPVLPIVIYLAMAHDVSLARGAMLSFALGVLLDSATGNSMGLFTFVLQASFLVARGAGFRLFMRGRLSQMAITASTAAVGSITLIALRSIFRKDSQIATASPRYIALAVIGSALTTGLLAPTIYQIVRRVDQLRRRDDAGAAFS